MACVSGKTVTNRKGFIRVSGNDRRMLSTDSKVVAWLVDLTTSPRLTGLHSTRLQTEYQLISAKATPVSLTEIHVPPPGSDGERTMRPPTSRLTGGNPAGRASFSSRF